MHYMSAVPANSNTELGIASVVCQFCNAPLRDTFVDLGPQPLCEAFVAAEDVERMEPFYPLHVRICRECLLVQLPGYVDREEIFREYAYFSSYSDSWVEHARRYADAMIERLGLGAESRVVELASNDGYLLQHFVARGIPFLGIEPARNVAAVAEAQGVPTHYRVLRTRSRRTPSTRTRTRRPGRREQRPGAGARPQRLRGRYRHPARAGRRRDA